MATRGRERDRTPRPVRADAQRNIDALLEAASAVFANSGVDAPIRQIAIQAGVGVGTLYRHFPQRSDLIVAIMRREMDACAEAAKDLSSGCKPGKAVELWMQRFVDVVTAKRGLAAALHSGDTAYESLPVYFNQRLRPTLRALLDKAIVAGEVRADVAEDDLLGAVSSLCMSAQGSEGLARARRMVTLLTDGLRCVTSPATPPS
jgi:AcrR family transcriptional regulator